MMRKARKFAFAGALVLALAACGSDEPAGDGQVPSTSEPTDEDSTAAATIQTGETDLGTVVSDADGLTLYMFGADENGESTCYDDCAATWPALTVDGEPVAGEGLDASKIDTAERTDGTVQVTYAGLPLYHFASDAEPGDIGGQGIGDIWFVVSPEGDPIRSKGTDSKGGGYQAP
jgi:predicted lipoprotein with Yx(FWY)xxD motif